MTVQYSNVCIVSNILVNSTSIILLLTLNTFHVFRALFKSVKTFTIYLQKHNDIGKYTLLWCYTIKAANCGKKCACVCLYSCL